MTTAPSPERVIACQPFGGTGDPPFGVRRIEQEGGWQGLYDEFISRASRFGNGLVHQPYGWPSHLGMEFGAGLAAMPTDLLHYMRDRNLEWRRRHGGMLAVYVSGHPVGNPYQHNSDGGDVVDFEFSNPDHRREFAVGIRLAQECHFTHIFYDNSAPRFSEFLRWNRRNSDAIIVGGEAIPNEDGRFIDVPVRRMPWLGISRFVESRGLHTLSAPTGSQLIWAVTNHRLNGQVPSVNNPADIARAHRNGWWIGSWGSGFDEMVLEGASASGLPDGSSAPSITP